MLVDSHCHLDFPDYSKDLDAVMARAAQSGVGLMLTISTHVTRFERVLEVAERFDNVYCTVGIHPHNAGPEPEVTVERLVELAKHPKVVGFGETGLDFYYDKSPRDRQRASFRTHIAAARAAKLPVVVHSRDADEETHQILAEEMEKGAFPGLIHCFSSGPAFARDIVDLGLFISISGIVTFKATDEVRSAVTEVPADRLLVETDCPFLAPVPFRGKRNEPAHVTYTAAKVAELKGVGSAEMARITTDNFFRLFSKVPRP